MKIVSIVGRKNTGKTSLTVKVIEELTRRGYNVASIKHSHHSIEMDKENTDTWKHKQAGANLVVGVGSTTFFNARQEMDLNRILFLIKHIGNFDFVVIEGYKSYNYPKIITSPNVRDEYTICEVDSFTIDENGVFANNCGYNDGEIIASKIREGSLTVDDLDKTHSYLSIDGNVVGLNRFVSDYLKQNVLGVINTLNLKDFGVDTIGKVELIIPDANSRQKPKECLTEIEINNKPLIINSFTNDIVTNSIKAMINSLKTDEDVEKIEITISDINPDDLSQSNIGVKINDGNLKINDFTQGILKETIYAIINTLKVNDEIEEIKIKVEE